MKYSYLANLPPIKNYLLVYDESSPGDFEAIYKILRSYRATYVQKSVREIRSTKSAAEILSSFEGTLKSGDSIKIYEIN